MVSPGPINQTIEELKNGECTAMATRDKGKGVRFAKDRDTLPPHVIHLIEKESKGNRQFKIAMINRLYERRGDGSSRLNLGDRLFRRGPGSFTAPRARRRWSTPSRRRSCWPPTSAATHQP